ncbi:hypothetical protein CISIN_1g041726mg, partial [Citrus sinensis]
AREAELRNCYAETIHLETDEFIKMVLVMDVVFIIEFFMKFYQPNFRTNEDPILRKSFLHDDVKLEILLLENQLPLFILNDLFNLAKTICRQPNIDLHQETTFCIKKIPLGKLLENDLVKLSVIESEVSMKCDIMSVL